VVEIEFFLSEQPPDELGHREEIGGAARMRRRIAVDRPHLSAVVMLAASAALMLVASFQRLYTVRAGTDGHRTVYWVDGWGRLRADNGQAIPPNVHEVRWGIALCVCAAGFVLLAVALAASTVRALASRFGARTGSVIGGAAIGIAGTLAGLLAGAALDVDAVSNRFTAQTADFGLGMHYSVPIGSFLWFGLAALVAALLAIAAIVYLRRDTLGSLAS
jgi:hypothetical protein